MDEYNDREKRIHYERFAGTDGRPLPLETAEIEPLRAAIYRVHRALLRRPEPALRAQDCCEHLGAALEDTSIWLYFAPNAVGQALSGHCRSQACRGGTTADDQATAEPPPCLTILRQQAEASLSIDETLCECCRTQEGRPIHTHALAIEGPGGRGLLGICRRTTPLSAAQQALLAELADDLALALVRAGEGQAATPPGDAAAGRTRGREEHAAAPPGGVVTPEKFAHSERHFRAIFQALDLGIVLAEAETGRLLLSNDTLHETVGTSSLERAPTTLDELFGEAVCSRGLAALSAQPKTTARLHELPLRRSNGAPIVADLTFRSVVLDGRRFLLGSVRDVTERRDLRASLAQADRMASIGLLAAGVAHEINNPLTYVLYNLETISGELPSLIGALSEMTREIGTERCGALLGQRARMLAPNQLEHLRAGAKDAYEGAQRVRDIVKDLRTFARVDEDRHAPVDLNAVIEGALNMAFNELKYRARIKKDYGKIPFLMGNDGRLAQVFLNLLVNAAQAIEEGAVESNYVGLRTYSDGSCVVAEVSDSGCGIAAADLPRLFEPFFSTKKVGEGSGLGLSICQGIVAKLGGAITVESTVGVGTTFRVKLPMPALAEAKAGDSEAFEEPSTGPSRSRILVIDDDRRVGAVIARMLGAEHDVTAVESAQAAIALIEGGRPFDALVCDLLMPEMTGMDLYNWLRAQRPALARRVLFVSGGAFTPKARAFLRQVTNPRLEKPFEMDSLRAWLHETLS